MEMTLTLQNGIPILHPHGKITGKTVSEFRDRLGLWIDDTNTPALLIDFADVHKLDSSALGMLVNAHVIAHRHETEIGLINVSKRIRNLTLLTRLVKVFQCFPDAEAAVETLAPSTFSGAVVRQLPTTPP